MPEQVDRLNARHAYDLPFVERIAVGPRVVGRMDGAGPTETEALVGAGPIAVLPRNRRYAGDDFAIELVGVAVAPIDFFSC